VQEEETIIGLGIQIVWVLEQDSRLRPGTATSCRQVIGRQLGSDQGLCVGDGQTEPMAGVFDASPFSIRRGFDMLVRRSDMRILYTTSHGTPAGNQNLTGPQLVAELRRIIGR